MKTKSSFGKLNIKDYYEGFIATVVGAILTSVYQMLESGVVNLTWAYWKPVLIGALSAGVLWLLKKTLTNSDGKFGKTENTNTTNNGGT